MVAGNELCHGFAKGHVRISSRSSQKDRTVCCYFDDEFLQILGGYACLSSISHRHSSILGMLLQQKKLIGSMMVGGTTKTPSRC